MRPYLPLRPGSRFGALYRAGRRKRSGPLTVIRGQGTSEIPQVGVVAGRAVGNAVMRNRAKRRLREAAHRVDLQPNTAYVVVASRGVLDASFADLVGWLDAAVSPNTAARNEERT